MPVPGASSGPWVSAPWCLGGWGSQSIASLHLLRGQGAQEPPRLGGEPGGRYRTFTCP